MKAPKGIKKLADGGKVDKKARISPELQKKYNLLETGYTKTPDGSVLTGTPLTTNVNYPTPQEQQGFSKPVTNRTFTNTSGTVFFNPTLQQAGTPIGNRKVDVLNNGLTMITNPDGSIQYFKGGVEQKGFNKGGKIMKAPKGVKGYANGGDVQYDEYGNPILSSNTLPLSSGTQFQTQGDYPVTNTAATTQLDKNGKPSSNDSKARDVANATGGALGGYGSGYFAVKPNESNADVVRSTGLASVSKMGGIGGAIGGIAAIGDQIGAPIKKRSEKVNSSGEVINESKAKQNAIGGALFSPSKALTYRAESGNWGDISGKDYLNYLEKPYKEQIAKEKDAAVLSEIEQAKLARNRSETSFKPVNTYRPHEFAKGGKIVGEGTAKSDSINAKIKGNSFVVPEENSEVAETIRKVVLKKAPSVKAKLNQKGGENVKLSNGEHLFTPNEVSKIEASGIDLDRLAPDADNDEYYANGGKIPVGTKVGNATWNGKNWTEGKNIYSAEGGKQFENAYYKKINDERKAYLDNIESENRRNNPNYKAPVKSASELDKLKQAPSDKLGKPVLKAPSVKKTVAKTNGITNENYVAPQDLALVEQLKTPNVTKETVVTPTANKTQETVSTTPSSTGDKGKGWKAWSPMFGNYLGNAIETGASLAQIKLGRDALNKAGVRPVGEIDPSFQANVDRAHAQSKYGFTAEQNALINQENQNATNAARFAARNYSGGSGGNAFNMERSAINEGWGRGLQAKIANTNLMLDKQQLDNQLSLQKAGMSRQLFEDKMDAFQQNQQAGALLKQTGWKNLIGATRYASALNSINQQNQLGQ